MSSRRRSKSRRFSGEYDFGSQWPEYVPVAQRREEAKVKAAKLKKSGDDLEPITVGSRGIATSFWGRSWCRNLEQYSDYESRLPRGRSYLRNGLVLDLKVKEGRVLGKVCGSYVYDIEVKIAKLPTPHWNDVRQRCKGSVASLIDLMQGKLSKSVMEVVTDPNGGLFPNPGEIKLSCTCPDWADMCKHVAAVLYGVGAKLDSQPELLFTLRGVDHTELVTAAVTSDLEGEKDATLAGVDLGALFDIDLDAGEPKKRKSPNRKIKKPKSP